MPTYEYVCKACGHLFEIVRSMNDEPLTVCPECGGELRKVFGAPAISFRGSGFYATDHRKKSREGSKEPAKSSDTKPGKGSGEGLSGEKGAGSEKKSESTGSSGSKDSSSSGGSGGSSDSKGSSSSTPKEGASS
jgi:putative FmdB family regulatory protein